MDILHKIAGYAKDSKKIALQGEHEKLTYAQLEEYSNRIAAWICENLEEDRAPIVVYGHKSVYMILCFFAAVKAGRAYCPLDNSLPLKRFEQIIETVMPGIIFDVEAESSLSSEWKGLINRKAIMKIIEDNSDSILPEVRVRGEDIFYIIFTSGSSGMPKGVKITADCLAHYLDWSVKLGNKAEEKCGKVFLNQAPFSFDLSVMDLYTCLAVGGTLAMMTGEIQKDYRRLLMYLRESKAAVWVSTPSFAELCLADKNFNEACMDAVELFLFCGETLSTATAQKLMDRFHKAKIVNTYGPTEATVAVTQTEITRAMTLGRLLPAGRVKQGSRIEIWRPDGQQAADGEAGEIVILGDTVSPGYLKLPSKTAASFFTCCRDGESLRGYHTGDIGYLSEGQLYCTGRMNRQVKLHGYRIELPDIEQNLLKLPQIDNAVVIPAMKEQRVSSLTAFVTGVDCQETPACFSKRMKELLKHYLPEYMIPKKIIYLPTLPMNTNGKVDRNRLVELL